MNLASRLGRALCAVLLAGTAAAVVAPGAAAQADESELAAVEVARYGGADRYATSLLVAEAVAAEAGGNLDWAVMVSGRSWHEAVVAASVAGRLGAPVLMTPPDHVRDDALEFLDQVRVSSVLLVSTDSGPTRSIDVAVDEQLRDAGLTVERIGGSDRYMTGVAVAERLGAVGTLGSDAAAIIASGEVFADALVAGPLSAHGAHPVLLTPQDRLHSAVADYLRDAEIERVVVMGGTAALSEAVETSISALGISVDRMAGATRFETAIQAGQFAAQHSSGGCFATGRVGLARARVPFDSFSAGPLMARQCAPLVLTDPKKIPQSTADYLDGVRRSVDDGDVRLTVFGGDAAVSQAAIDAYLARGGVSAPDETEQDMANDCGGSSTDPAQQVFSGRNSIARDPDWSPDCRHFAYAWGGSLFVRDRDGSNYRELISVPGVSVSRPVWSPDGSKIAFVARTEEGSQGRRFTRMHIHVVGADGTGAAQLTSGAVEDNTPTWSPDGRKLAFGRQTWTEETAEGRRGTEWFIATIDADGRNLTELTRGPFSESTPSWSPDGTRIALVWNRQLAVMDPDGTNVETLPVDRVHNGWSKLSWSPDGTQLAFSVLEERAGRPVSGQSNIAVYDFSTKKLREITDLDGEEINPDWSADGQLILFNTFEMGYAYSRIFVTGAGSP